MFQNKLGVQGRIHAVWIIAENGGRDVISELFALAESDADARVRAIAVRAIADKSDPVFVETSGFVAGRARLRRSLTFVTTVIVNECVSEPSGVRTRAK